MLRTVLTYRPRPSLVWSVGFHAALGAALWGSGIVQIPLRGSTQGIVVSLASPSVEAPPAALELQEALPLEPEETLPLEPLLHDDMLDEFSELEEAAATEPEAAPEDAPIVARALTRRQLPTRRRATPAPANTPVDPAVPVDAVSEPAAPQAEPAAAAPTCVGPMELAAHCPPPPYPRSAERRGLQGTVELLVFVHPDGQVHRVDVITSSGHGVLDDAARKAVLDWRYAPATLDGSPVARTVTKRISFQIP